MIIENLDALKTWLSETLEPICDADPSASPSPNQLDVFLQKETQPFVDKLFEAIDNKNYLPQPEPPSTLIKVEKDEQKKDETNREDDREKKVPRRVNHTGISVQGEEMIAKETTVPGRGNMTASHQGGTRTEIATIAEEAAVAVTVVAEAGAGARIEPETERDRIRSRSRSQSRTRSKSRERDSGKLKLDLAPVRPEGGDGYTPAALVPTETTSHFPVPTLSSTITVIAPTHHHSNNTTESWSDFRPGPPVDRVLFNRGPPPQQRKRCRDYDEKGFCMRGDMCPFDHGSDPVVWTPHRLQASPHHPLMNPPPVNLRPPPRAPQGLSLPAFHLLQVHLLLFPPLQPSGMDSPPNSMTSSVPTIVTSGMRSSLPQAALPLFLPDNYETDVYNPETDVYNPEAPSITNTSRPMYRHRVNAQRPNLIGLTMGEVDHPPRDKIPNNMRIVMESNARKRPPLSHDGGLPPKKPWFEKPNFNQPNHQGYHNRVPFSANAKLLVRQIPSELNNISKLNEHFSKFGTIVNLQVAFQNDPEGALIQFASPDEAKRAMQSPEAVLNNRFIRVHWYREEGGDGLSHPHQQPQTQPAMPSATSLKQSVKDRLGPMLNSEPSQDSSVASQQNCSKMSVKDRLGFSAQPAAPAEKVFSTSLGLTKTVYNPAALKAAQKNSEEALKKKQQALRLQQDVRKKKHEILEKHIETQKLLISKVEKNKAIKAEDRANIMETLGMITKSITKLQEEIKGISSSSNPLRTAKSRAQAQKELLDTELDLYNKTQTGQDTALLKIKYTQLQIEAARRGILSPGRGRGVLTRGRGALRARGRGSRGRGRGVHAVVDYRPRALEICGFTEADHVDLLPHFAQFGEIEDCHIDENTLSAVISFRTRGEAEQAALHGVRFNNQTLRLAWHKAVKTLSAAHADEAEQDDEYPEESLSDDALLQDDDEEEDDNEPRSWRR
ncbi:hypothetical protein KUCAC02_002278 [Chaenocephalus aceratus]|uniref:Uncharacterized protein n=1 Tax=Chaenocephalus aceratus TaxID=36190 RepID=A0ACB9XT77_CHAAC|nr:hypothetical protein KUCAC02_002278 [Chaenocephalus aceratus]